MGQAQKIQQNIIGKIASNIDGEKIHYWIYSNQGIIFDFLVKDYFISLTYNCIHKTFNIIPRNQSLAGNFSVFPALAQFLAQQLTTHNPVVSDKSVSFQYSAEDEQVSDLFAEILKLAYTYLRNHDEIEDILKAEELADDAAAFAALLAAYPTDYIGITNQSRNFLLSYARDNDLSEIVYALHRQGFIAVEQQVGVTVFRRIDRQNYKDFLCYFPESFAELNHVFYTLEKPKQFYPKNNLLILFSYTNQSNEKPMERYYTHSFPFIANSILPNTYIVRICDLADAFGSHGLNTDFDADIENNLQAFIKSLMSLYSIKKENVLIMGASSGGTGALYHGIIGGYKTYAIDPYLGNTAYYGHKDTLYLNTLKPSIREVYENLSAKIKTLPEAASNEVVVMSSEKSEFYADVAKLKTAVPEISLCVYNNHQIQKHSDVSPNAVSLSNTIVNNLLLGIPVSSIRIDLLQDGIEKL